ATDEVAAVADTLGAGVAKALLGKAVLPDDLPYVTGSIGLLGTKPSWDLMQDCDTLLMIGSSFPYSEFLPPEGKAGGVQIDIDGRMIGIRYPMEVDRVGGAKETLQALLPYLRRKQYMGLRRPARDRREVRIPGARRDRPRRRRRVPDERDERADHRRARLAALERSAPRRARPEQPRPESGDVGAARDRGRPEVRSVPGS